MAVSRLSSWHRDKGHNLAADHYAKLAVRIGEASQIALTEPKPVNIPGGYTECIACSGKLDYTEGDKAAQCQSCGGVHGNQDVIYSGLVHATKPMQGNEDPAHMRYFDITYRDGSRRIHGWFSTITGCVVQYG